MRGKPNHVIRNVGSVGSVGSIDISYIPYIPHVPTFTIGGDGYIRSLVVTDLIYLIVQVLKEDLERLAVST